MFDFKSLKKADYAILGGGAILLVVLLLATFGINKFLYKTPVLAEKDILFTVFFRGVTITDMVSPFKIGESTFITIRNVPYTKLEIKNVAFERRRVLIETAQKGNYQPVEDISEPCLFDFTVTVADKAKITDDGVVVGGNKVKIGIPVVLEGPKYKLSGVISNVQITETKAEDSKAAEDKK